VDSDELEAAPKPESSWRLGGLLARFAIVSTIVAAALWMMAIYGLSWLSEPFSMPK
jgi:hypothetical protein